MKRWIMAVLVLALGLMLAGCARGKVDAGQIADAETDNKMFMVVSEEGTGEVIVDKSTRVMYWISKCSDNSGNMTLLVNADGMPRIWEG